MPIKPVSLLPRVRFGGDPLRMLQRAVGQNINDPRFNKECVGNFPRLKAYPLYSELTGFEKMNARWAADVIQTLLAKDAIYAGDLESVCDFGTGLGYATVGLLSTLQLDPKNLTVVDPGPGSIQNHRLESILDPAHMFCEDGIPFLHQRPSQFSMITASMLGPEKEYTGISQKLLEAAKVALRRGGLLIVYSDDTTMKHFARLAREMQMSPERFRTKTSKHDVILVRR